MEHLICPHCNYALCNPKIGIFHDGEEKIITCENCGEDYITKCTFVRWLPRGESTYTFYFDSRKCEEEND